MERLDPRAEERISGRAWQGMRPQFEQISQALLAVSSSACGELTTIYVKYHTKETGGQPYGVIWLKKSTELVVGFALPEGYDAAELRPPLQGYKYANLTAFLRITPQDNVPALVSQWAHDAYKHVRSKMP